MTKAGRSGPSVDRRGFLVLGGGAALGLATTGRPLITVAQDSTEIRYATATWMYDNTSQYHKAGLGSALAWVIAGISLIVVVPYIRIMSRR